jgi:hypothetical protein
MGRIDVDALAQPARKVGAEGVANQQHPDHPLPRTKTGSKVAQKSYKLLVTAPFVSRKSPVST